VQIVLYGSIAWRHPLGIGQAIEWARRFGWSAVDARGMSLDIPGDVTQRINAFGYDMLGPRQLRGSARADLRRRLADAGIPLLGIYCSSPVNLTGAQGQSCRDLFRDYLRLGADLGVRWIRSINNSTSGGAEPAMTPDDAYRRTVDGLREVGALASQLEIGLLLENNENTVTADAESLLRLKQDLAGVCHVGITYDPVNAYFQGLDVEHGFELLAGQIDVLHVKNVKRSRERRWDYIPRGDYSYEWTALADGDLNWPRLIKKAAEGGFDGPVVYEYVNPFKGMPVKYWDTLPEPEEAARREAEFLKSWIVNRRS
jgi:sugar phosphate isomerase/epimerase